MEIWDLDIDHFVQTVDRRCWECGRRQAWTAHCNKRASCLRPAHAYRATISTFSIYAVVTSSTIANDIPVVICNVVCNVETSYFTQLKICYLMTTFRCLSDFLITSWLFTARWSTWPGNHLVPCVAELVGSCIPIHAHRCLPDLKCLFLSIWSVAVPLCRLLLLCPSRWHGSLPRHGLWWLTCELHCSPLPWKLGSMYQVWRSH